MEPTTTAAEALCLAPVGPASPGSATAHTASSRLGVATLAVAALAGALVSAFVTRQAPGLGTALASITLVGAWVALARLRRRPILRVERATLVALFVLGLLPALRSSPWLLAYDAVLFVLGVACLPSLSRPRVASRGFGAWLHVLVEGAGAWVSGAPRLARDELDTRDLRAQLKAPALGLAIALPFGGVFLALFSSADAVFGALVGRLFSVDDAGGKLAYVGVALVAAWTLLGLVWGASREETRHPPTVRTAPRLGAAELSWGLLFIAALFVAFLVVQVVQIAGFAEALALPGVTYSLAAREGFFQLLAVTGLVAALVPVADGMVAGAGAAGVRRVRLTLSVLLALTALVASSALWRMALYIDAYGLTTLRLHASALMLWLVLLLAWMHFTVLRGARGRFILGAGASLLAGVLLLHVVNPDGAIARANIARIDARALDVGYLGELSDDALPIIAAHAPALSPSARARACELVEERAALARERVEGWPLLSWSLARQRAAAARCEDAS